MRSHKSKSPLALCIRDHDRDRDRDLPVRVWHHCAEWVHAATNATKFKYYRKDILIVTVTPFSRLPLMHRRTECQWQWLPKTAEFRDKHRIWWAAPSQRQLDRTTILSSPISWQRSMLYSIEKKSIWIQILKIDSLSPLNPTLTNQFKTQHGKSI